MVEVTINKIKAIEAKASEIIKRAQQDSFLNLRKNREKQEQEIGQLKEELKEERERLLQAAEEGSKKEAKNIEAETKKEIGELKKGVQPKIPLAKKEILRCRS